MPPCARPCCSLCLCLLPLFTSFSILSFLFVKLNSTHLYSSKKMWSPFPFSCLPSPTEIRVNSLLLHRCHHGYIVTMPLWDWPLTPTRGSTFFEGKGLFLLQLYLTAQSPTYAENSTSVAGENRETCGGRHWKRIYACSSTQAVRKTTDGSCLEP